MRMLSVVWEDSKEDEFVEAFSKLNVLEDLDVVHFNWKNTLKVLSLPKLQKLRIGGDFIDVNDILENIGTIRGLDVIGLTLNVYFWSWRSSLYFQNLRNLTLIDDGDNTWRPAIFNNMLLHFPNLEQINLKDTQILPHGS